MENIVYDFVHKYKFKLGKDTDEKQLCDVLCRHFEIFVKKMASLAALVVTLENDKKLTPFHVDEIRKYIQKTGCKDKGSMHGGNFPSDYFGYPHPAYSPMNAGEDILKVDLSGSLARPGMGPQNGGGPASFVAHSSLVKAEIRKHMVKHKLQCSNDGMDSLLRMMDGMLSHLAHDLKACEPITIKKLQTFFDKKRNFVFQ